MFILMTKQKIKIELERKAKMNKRREKCKLINALRLRVIIVLINWGRKK